MEKIIGKLVFLNKKFNLIKNGDRVAVACSGGKDSMLLLKALKIMKLLLAKNAQLSFDIEAIHLKMNLCAADYEKMEEWCKKEGINLSFIDSQVGEILKNNMHKGKLQCSLCSKLRKGMLIAKAKELNCNKIAFGHHGDDAIETLFMNMIYNGKLESFEVIQYMDKTDITMIRPFMLVREKEIISEVKKQDIPVLDCSCPMSGFTKRTVVKKYLNNNLYADKEFKDVAYNNLLVAIEKQLKTI